MQAVRDKKKFKETKVGKFLAEKAPKVLDAVGDLLPDEGLTGIVKRLISSDPDMTAADKIEFEKLMYEHEIETARIEAQDRASARTRETELVKATGHIDYLHTIVGLMICLSFIGLQVVVVRMAIPTENRDYFIHVMTIIDMAVGALLNYQYGSSRGSKDKTKILSER